MIPYRTRNLLRKLVVTGLALLLIAAALLLCWFLWLNRFVIYTQGGAMLDFGLSPEISAGQQAEPQEPMETVDIYYNEGENAILPETTELTQLSGVCITGQMLTENFENVQKYVSTLPAETPVLLDVKNIRGEFYYTTTLGKQSKQIEPQQMDALIASLQQTGRYLIARLPAFRDYWFGRYNVPSGLAEKGKGGALWMDNGCYWLDPTAEGTQFYLVNIARELHGMGFDEVVYYDFRFPSTDKIVFDGDKEKAIADAAAALATACATEKLCISFEVDNPEFPLPVGNCRVYLRDVAAENIDTVAQLVPTDHAALHVLFYVTSSEASDTRFEKYSALRPLESAR